MQEETGKCFKSNEGWPFLLAAIFKKQQKHTTTTTTEKVANKSIRDFLTGQGFISCVLRSGLFSFSQNHFEGHVEQQVTLEGRGGGELNEIFMFSLSAAGRRFTSGPERIREIKHAAFFLLSGSSFAKGDLERGFCTEDGFNLKHFWSFF